MKLSQQLIYKVRSSLTEKGTSLRAVCLQNNIDSGNIYPVLRGEFKGESSIKSLEVILTAAFSDSQLKRMGLSKYINRLNQTTASSLAAVAPALPVTESQP